MHAASSDFTAQGAHLDDGIDEARHGAHEEQEEDAHEDERHVEEAVLVLLGLVGLRGQGQLAHLDGPGPVDIKVYQQLAFLLGQRFDVQVGLRRDLR